MMLTRRYTDRGSNIEQFNDSSMVQVEEVWKLTEQEMERVIEELIAGISTSRAGAWEIVKHYGTLKELNYSNASIDVDEIVKELEEGL